jgi:YggT family protein
VLIRSILCTALGIYLLILLLRIVFSWIPMAPENPLQAVNSFCARLTEPLLTPIRNLLPPVQMGGMALDLSSMALFLVVIILRGFIC